MSHIQMIPNVIEKLDSNFFEELASYLSKEYCHSAAESVVLIPLSLNQRFPAICYESVPNYMYSLQLQDHIFLSRLSPCSRFLFNTLMEIMISQCWEQPSFLTSIDQFVSFYFTGFLNA